MNPLPYETYVLLYIKRNLASRDTPISHTSDRSHVAYVSVVSKGDRLPYAKRIGWLTSDLKAADTLMVASERNRKVSGAWKLRENLNWV